MIEQLRDANLNNMALHEQKIKLYWEMSIETQGINNL